jgi:hypothetical protein
VESISEVFWEFINLVIAVDLNGFLGCVHDHMAFVAPMEMFVQFHSQVLSDPAIQVIGQLF